MILWQCESTDFFYETMSGLYESYTVRLLYRHKTHDCLHSWSRVEEGSLRESRFMALTF